MSIRLIDVQTLRLKSFNSQKAPPYAVLSHTWVEDEEVSFQEMCQMAVEPNHPATRTSGYRKIWETCRVSLAYGLNYAWVDTCCIDKSSSAELSEAINSMFRWYRDAKVCFAYLSDYSFLGSGHAWKMKDCKWFTRGWCLQELIAPKELIFYDKDWKESGSKSELEELVAWVTRIDRAVLEDHKAMYLLPVAQRMSWASSRITTRVEDIAYCLLGIFDIHMPMLYGEGEKAFLRLQEEIIRRLNDTSVFLFSPKAPDSTSFSPPEAMQISAGVDSTDESSETSKDGSLKSAAMNTYLNELSGYQFCSMFANSPTDFSTCGDIVHKHGSQAPIDRQAFSVTNRGIQLGKQILWYDWGHKHCFIWDTAFRHSNHVSSWIYGAIFLRKIGRNLFARVLLPEAQINVARYIFHEDICVLLHITPSTQYQIHETLKTVLQIDVKNEIGPDPNVSLSQPTPMDIWDASQKLFLFPENFYSTHRFSLGVNSFTRSVRVTVTRGVLKKVDFYLRFLIGYTYLDSGGAYVLLSKDPASTYRRSYADDDELFDEHLNTALDDGKLSARSHLSFDGITVDAHIYHEKVLFSRSQVYICSVEINRSQDKDISSWK